jgi:hypothetical protein
MQQESQNRPFKFRRSPRPGRASVQLVGCSLSGHRRRFWSLIDLLVRLRAACASGDSESPLAIPGPGGGCPGHPERVDVPLNSTGLQPPSGRGPAASTPPRPFRQGATSESAGPAGPGQSGRRRRVPPGTDGVRLGVPRRAGRLARGAESASKRVPSTDLTQRAAPASNADIDQSMAR